MRDILQGLMRGLKPRSIGGQLGRARWASTGTARESTARERPGLWPFGLVPCPCPAPGRAWAGEAARGTSTGPARLVGRHVCGPFKRRSAPSSPSRRRSLAPLPLLRHAAAVSLAPLLSRASAAAALLPRPPPIEPPLSSGPPSIPSSATSTAGAETARHAGLHPLDGSTSARSPPSVPSPTASTVTPGCRRRRSSAAAPRRPAPLGPGVPNGTARHVGALTGSCPGRDVGTAALRSMARRRRRAPACARAGMSARRHYAAWHGGAAVPRRARAVRPVGHLYYCARCSFASCAAALVAAGVVCIK